MRASATATRRSFSVPSAFSRVIVLSISSGSSLRRVRRARNCASDSSRADNNVSATAKASGRGSIRSKVPQVPKALFSRVPRSGSRNPTEQCPWNAWNHWNSWNPVLRSEARDLRILLRRGRGRRFGRRGAGFRRRGGRGLERLAEDRVGHLVARYVGGGRNALHLELELVHVRGPAQRFVVADQPLLEQAEDGLVERLHAVLRRALGNRAGDQMRLVLVDD